MKSYTKATIARDALPFIRGAIEELDRLFRPFGLVDIYHDTYHWYILFDSPTSALEAQQFVHDKNHRVLGYLIELTIPSRDNNNTSHLPISPKISKLQPNVSFSNTNHAAKHILYQELADVFLKDIKNRIAGPCIYDFLSPALVSTCKKLEPVEKISVISPVTTTTAAALESDIVAHALLGQDPIEEVSSHDHSIYKLPRFKRKSISHRLDHSSAKTIQLSNRSEDEKEDVDIGSGCEDQDLAPTQQPRKQRPYLHSSEDGDNDNDNDDEEEDFLGTKPPPPPPLPLSKKQKLVKNKLLQKEVYDLEDLSDTSVSSDAHTYKKRRDSKLSALSNKRKLSKQRRSSVPKKKIVTDQPSKQRSQSFCVTPMSLNSPSSLDVDVDGDDSDGEQQQQQDELRNLMNRRKEESERHLTKQYPSYDQTMLQDMLDHIDDRDREEELWSQPEPTIELNKEWDPLYQTKDVEDLEYLQVAIIEKVDPNANSSHNGKRIYITYANKKNQAYSTFYIYISLRKTRPQ